MTSTDLTTTDGLDELLRADARLRLTGAVIAALISAPAVAILVWLVPGSGGDEPAFVAMIGAAAILGTVWGPVLRPWRLRRALDQERSGDRAERVHVAVLPPATQSFIGGLVGVWTASEPTSDAPDHVFAADVSAEGLVGVGPAPAAVAGGPHRLAVYRLDDGPPIVTNGRTNIVQRLHARSVVHRWRRLDRLEVDAAPDGAQLDLARTVGREVAKRAAMMLAVTLVGVLAVGLG